MTQTRAERLAYARAYNRWKARAWHQRSALWTIVRAYRARLNDGFTARRCDTCLRWTRGPGSAKWGICSLDFEWVEEPNMWPDSPIQDRKTYKPVTHESFGCTNWLPHEVYPLKTGNIK